MNKKFLFLLQITTSSTGSFDVSREFFIKWLKKEKKFGTQGLLILLLRNFFLKEPLFIKEKIFLFFSFFLISQTRFIQFRAKDFLAFTIFFLIRNLKSVVLKWDTNKFCFFRIFFRNIPTGASLNPSVLKFILSFLTNQFFLRKKKKENFPLLFLFRFYQNGFEKDVVTNLFFKINSENFFYSLKKNLLEIVKINQFLVGALLYNTKRLNFNIVKDWEIYLGNLKFETLCDRQILKLNFLNWKKNRIKKFLENFQKFEFQKKKGLINYSNQLEEKGLYFSTILKKQLHPKISSKKERTFNVFLEHKYDLFFLNKGGLTVIVSKEKKKKKRYKKINKTLQLLLLEKKINKNKKRIKNVFLKPKIKNYSFFIRNFFLESISDSFFRKKKNGENFSNWFFRYSVVSAWILVNLKAVTKIFLLKKGLFQIFEEFFSKYSKNSVNIPDQYLIFEFSNWSQNLFWKNIIQTPKVLNYLLLDPKSNSFSNNFGWSFHSLIFFSKKSLSGFFSIKKTLPENKFCDSIYRFIFFFCGFLFPQLFSGKRSLKLPKKIKDQKIKSFHFFNGGFFEKLSLFFLGWKTKKLFLKQLIGFFFFQLYDRVRKDNFYQRFLKWIEVNMFLIKRNENEQLFLEKMTGWIFISRLKYWLGLILRYWCDLFWDRTLSLLFFLIRKVLTNSFLFYKNKQEKIIFKIIESWFFSSAFFKKKSTFIKKTNCILNPDFRFKLIFYLQKFLKRGENSTLN